MPVGPSHNRGRSSGSSFSSRSSGSSYRSSSSRSYSSGHHHHRHSHTTYYSSGVEIEMSPRGWAIFGLIWGFLFVIIFANWKRGEYMKYLNCVENSVNVNELKRIASAYVEDCRRLDFQELKNSLVKT